MRTRLNFLMCSGSLHCFAARRWRAAQAVRSRRRRRHGHGVLVTGAQLAGEEQLAGRSGLGVIALQDVRTADFGTGAVTLEDAVDDHAERRLLAVGAQPRSHLPIDQEGWRARDVL